ncbi:hypothetical protein JOC77_003930 [Peribacillus deserti]|uniref:DUF4025 domain-containing protein n=1 Tax=Peribacillus deserti TaxID=673318 RepID=A0ABS2QP05_9BACI|nr:hypothetical protein [Peribacillus deserti]MBM7694469.1 hypothetical protein [Peribacillus deserti]
MVNQDFEQFNKIQQKHKTVYIGTGQDDHVGKEDPHSHSNNKKTDYAPGVTGREV